MKFSTYNPQVQLNNGGNASVQLSSNPLAYGDNGMGAGALAKGMQQFQAGVDQFNERQDKQNYTDAMNAFYQEQYNMMSQDTDKAKGFLNRQLKDAEGAGLQYQEATKKLQADIEKNYKFFNPSYKMALQTAMQSATFDGFKQVQNVEYKEIEKYKGVQVTETTSNLSKLGALQGSNPEALKNYFGSLRMTIDRTYENESADNRDLRYKAAASAMAKNVVTSLVGKKDFVSAQKVLTDYSQYLTPEEITTLQNNITTKSKALNASDIAYDMKFVKNMNAKEARDYIDTLTTGEVIPEQKEGTTWIKKDSVDMNGLNDNAQKGLNTAAYLFNKLFGEKMLVTSAMDGKHQSHDGQSIDITEDWDSDLFANKDNRNKFIAELAKYGITVENEYEKDSLYKKGDHLHLDFSNYKEPTEQPMSRADKEEIFKEYLTYSAQYEKVRKADLESFKESILPTVVSFAKSKDGVKQMDALMLQYAENSDQHKLLKALKGEYFSGSGSSNNKAPSSDQLNRWAEMLKSGQFRNGLPTELENGVIRRDDVVSSVTEKSRLIEYVKSTYGDNPATIDKVNDMYARYLAGDGEFAYTDQKLTNIVEQSMEHPDSKSNLKGAQKDREKAVRRKTALNFIREYRGKNGENPGEGKILEAIIANVIPITIASYQKQEPGWEDIVEPKDDVEYARNEYKVSRAEMHYAMVDDIRKHDGSSMYSVIGHDANGNTWSKAMTKEELDMLFNRRESWKITRF